ncbi:MAG: DUF2325 domain-containing protein [Pseudomonadota bacterium]
MCELDAKTPLAQLFGAPATIPRRPPSRGQRLWELPPNTHCPVIGVCFPLGLLRKLVNKGLRGQTLADDYEVHVGAVAECAVRNRISKLLQDALDQRYAIALQRFRAAGGGEQVLRMWREAVGQGDVAGAFWAALSHPASSFQVQDTVLREMHMIQHQAGASTRIDHRRYQELQDENLAIGAELAQLQQRHARLMMDKARELDQLQEQLAARDGRLASLLALQERLPQLAERGKLEEQVALASQRLGERDAQVALLRQQLAEATLPPAAVDEPEPAREAAAPVLAELTDKTVLCVGGRHASVASYRGLTEEAGARFAHHDGGIEQAAELLESSLAAADLVICQTGCISHHAYWRVKAYCKRTGKRCVYLDNPSKASFSRGLRQIAIIPEAQVHR